MNKPEIKSKKKTWKKPTVHVLDTKDTQGPPPPKEVLENDVYTASS